MKSVEFDRRKSLLQLKREKFKDMAWDFHRFPAGYSLRHVPLENLTATDIWILIRQSIGLDYLIVLALEHLEQNPLMKTKHAEGDLLSAVLCADALVWKRNPQYRQRVTKVWSKASVKILHRATPELRMLLGDYRWFLKAEQFLPAD